MDEDLQRLLAEKQLDAAFELLLDRYQDKVFRLALSLLRDHTRAEDAAQDVFLKLWRTLPLYNAQASLSTWIYAITRNTCLNQIRRDSYRRTVPLEESEEQSIAHRPPPPEALDCRALLDTLPEKDRRILTLFYWQEKSYEEVAAMLNRPLGTIKSDLHRARRALAQLLVGRPTP